MDLEEVAAADSVIAGFSFDRPGDVPSRSYRATNVGFGLSYTLPVIVALLAPAGALCLIENPESHLHPKGQTKLAELAVRASRAGVQVFVETHSDHFMDGVRIAVRSRLDLVAVEIEVPPLLRRRLAHDCLGPQRPPNPPTAYGTIDALPTRICLASIRTH